MYVGQGNACQIGIQTGKMTMRTLEPTWRAWWLYTPLSFVSAFPDTEDTNDTGHQKDCKYFTCLLQILFVHKQSELNNGPLKMPILIARTCDYVTFHSKGDFADVSKSKL